MTHRGTCFTKEELWTVLESNRKRVYKRPMTATNPHKKRKEGINVFRKDSDDDLPKPPAKESPKKREKRYDEEEVYVKNKITVDDPYPVNIVSLLLIFTFFE